MRSVRLVTGAILGTLAFLSGSVVARGESRFPQPEFESGYIIPDTVVPAARALPYEYLDVAVLAAALALGSWFALRSRSRRGIFLLTLFSILYFGFWRKGCVCAVGSTQNVILGLVDSTYAVPATVIIFFLLPLLFTLLFGRTFCAAVCPLGTLQDVVVLRPVQIPSSLGHALGLVPYLYLTAVVLFAANGAGFMICRFDPFVPLYRLAGSSAMLLTGGAFLIAGIWIARPYCRFLCPYGVLLRWASLFSRRHSRITPAECVDCRLCEKACPFGAIRLPTAGEPPGDRRRGSARLAAFILLLPLLAGAGALLGRSMERPLSLVHPTVGLADQLLREDAGTDEGETLRSEAFRQTATPASVLFAEADALRKRFRFGGTLAGAFLGLVIGAKLIGLSVRRKRVGYEPDRATCFSCGRCFESCPIDHVHRHGTAGEYGELLEKLGHRAEGEVS